MKQGCPVNYRDERIGSTSILLRFLISLGKHSRTPLMAACAKGQLEVITLSLFPPQATQVVNHLLGVPGVEIDAQDSDGMTALMHAARLGSLEV